MTRKAEAKFTIWIPAGGTAAIEALRDRLGEKTKSKAIWAAIRGYPEALAENAALRHDLDNLRAALGRYRQQRGIVEHHAGLRDAALAELLASVE